MSPTATAVYEHLSVLKHWLLSNATVERVIAEWGPVYDLGTRGECEAFFAEHRHLTIDEFMMVLVSDASAVAQTILHMEFAVGFNPFAVLLPFYA